MESRRADFTLLALRCSGLGLALWHGRGKIQSLATGEGARFIEGVAKLGFPMPEAFAWAAALSEFVGGLCVFAGLGTRVTAAFAAFTVAVAAFARHHAVQQWMHGLGVARLPPETLEEWGKPELALIYLLCFSTLLFLGPGRISLDARIGRRMRHHGS